MVHIVKERADICIYDVFRSIHYHSIQHSQGVMAPSVWSESHHIVIEVGFEHRLQYPFECLLYQLIFVAVDIQRAGFPLSFGISTLLAGWGLYDFRFNLSTNAFTFASRLSPYISFVTPSILLLYLDVSPQSFNCFTGTIRASGYTVSHLPSSLSGCLAYHILH